MYLEVMSLHKYMQCNIVTYGRTTGRSQDTQAVSAMHQFQQLQPTVLLPLASLETRMSHLHFKTFEYEVALY